MSEKITLFMWEWQHVFRVCFRNAGRELFDELKPGLFRSTLLIGVLRPDGMDGTYPVCVDPESGPCGLEFFEGLVQEIERSLQVPRWMKASEDSS